MEKRNYQREMEAEIARLEGRKPALLLHSCCGPCSSAVLERLCGHFRVTVLYYNPNIEPEEEYLHRLSEQKRLLSLLPEEIPRKAGSAAWPALPCGWTIPPGRRRNTDLSISRPRCPSAPTRTQTT